MTFYNLQNSLKLPPKIQKMEFYDSISQTFSGVNATDSPRCFLRLHCSVCPSPLFLTLAPPCLKVIHETNKLDVVLDQGRI